MTRRKDSDPDRYDCARCDWKAITDPAEVCDCTCHVGGAYRPPCDVPGGCGIVHANTDLEPPADQLVGHARASEHWLCPCCGWSLTDFDPPNGCEHCLSFARSLLKRIGLLYDLLPGELARLRSGLGRFGGGGTAESPLPGGDALVLLGAGSEGHLEGADTTTDRDLPSISFELAWWARDWQERLGVLEDLGHRPAVTVRKATGYLERKARWAAQEHPGFDEFLADLRRLHGALEGAIGLALRHSKAGADCFDCGGDLMRLDRQHRGLSDVVTCENCGRTYDSESYKLALRARALVDTPAWITIAEAARATKRQVETIETWAKRGEITVACRRKDRRKIVWWPDVLERVKASKKRKRAS